MHMYLIVAVITKNAIFSTLIYRVKVQLRKYNLKQKNSISFYAAVYGNNYIIACIWLIYRWYFAIALS